jgi:long-chain acyl-CoA synthetase
LKQTYGSSEVGLVTCHRDGDIRPETVGPPLPNLEVRVTEEGEIVVRSQFMFSGYYKEPAKTADKLRDGWYHTGDFGHFDERGHLIVMDRMEDVMRLPGGKRFSPQFCEVRLRFSPYIKDVLMVAREDHPLIAAMINIDLANVGKWAESHHIAYTTFADLSQKPEVIELVRKEIERINSILPDYSRIRKFVNLHKEFDPDDAEMTRTRKIRRTYVEKRYADIIGAIYSGDLSVKVQSEVVYRDGRRGSAESEIGIVAL